MSATNPLLPVNDPDPLLRTIGRTPLVALRSEPRVLLKLEGLNLTGSVKVRPAYRMIRAAELDGQLTKNKAILDSTSGNTGIAYAFIAARRGYCVKLYMPASASAERKRLLTAYGAGLVLTEAGEGSDGAFFAMEQELRAHPDRYFCPDQYGNPENPQAHYETTGPEVFEQTSGAITHFVAGLGTSGTMMGAGRRLRELKPGIRLVAVQPDESFHGLEGLKHMSTSAHVPALYDDKFPDEFVGVSTEDAVATAKRMMREEGLYIGISAGAAVWAGLHLAGKTRDGTIVVICPDGGDRYSWD